MSLTFLSVGPRLAGLAAIVAGIYFVAINKHGALKSIEFQKSIGSPFSGSLSYWMFRVCGVALGLIAVCFGVVLLTGHR